MNQSVGFGMNGAMRFSERYGYAPIRSAIQVEVLDDATRTQIWNLLYATVFDHGAMADHEVDALFAPIWTLHYGYDADQYRSSYDIDTWVKTWIKKGPWNEVYDLVEVLTGKVPAFAASINSLLEEHKAGYRVLAGRVVPISDEAEVSEIETAIGSEHEGTRHHLKQALDLFADRDNPDYPNSIKESISAVESKAGQLTGRSTLGKALDEIKKSGPYVHPSLVEGWKKIYGWASDEDGLRHGCDSAPTPDQDLARYMLVTSSAFVNLLTAAEAKQGK
ncbi:AbiJ-NTD4 domain-containing protein [Rhodococcus sp. NPDC060176]|uniref:AbiJ-NTD4 domain-containing protein n=1 Tax=Rhodococcus sp. NPDC060176 TaxID=3347062 RepID=UPI00366130F0